MHICGAQSSVSSLFADPGGKADSGVVSFGLPFAMRQQASDRICAIACSPHEVGRTMDFLRAKGALKYTSVVAAPADAPISERYAALCSACSQGEHIRDSGGHALVVLDDISCMASCSALEKS